MDRIKLGFGYGLLAGVFKTIADLILNSFFPYDHSYYHHAYAVISGRLPMSWGEKIFALAIDFWWTGLLGVVLILLLRTFTSTPYLVRGLFFGSTLWFLFQTVGVIWELPSFYNSELPPLINGLISDSIYGLSLGYLLQRREQQHKT